MVNSFSENSTFAVVPLKSYRLIIVREATSIELVKLAIFTSDETSKDGIQNLLT